MRHPGRRQCDRHYFLPGGHVEFFKYMRDLLSRLAVNISAYFGGGGKASSRQLQIEEIHQYGITRIYSPDDGRHLACRA